MAPRTVPSPAHALSPSSTPHSRRGPLVVAALAVVVASSSSVVAANAASSYTQMALAVTLSAPTGTGATATATTTVKASVNTYAQYYGVCVRNSAGQNLDFWKRPATITTTGTASQSASRVLPNGSYTAFPCVYDGAWRTVLGPQKAFSVGTAGPTPAPTAAPTTPAPTTAPTTPAPTTAPTSSPPSGAPVGVPGAWILKFSDEFNGTALDTAKWNTLDGKTQNNVVNRTKNVSVGGGNLGLQLNSDGTGAIVSSSQLDGWGKVGYEAPIGSYTESRVYFPGTDAQPIYNFPAAWTSGHRWPSNGEHDYAEGLSGRLTANYHYGSDYNNHVANNSGPIAGTWHNAFHVYGVHRKATTADVYWDGRLIRTYSTRDNGGAHTLLFNVGKSNSRTPVTGAAGMVKVDYVKVWQK